MRDNNDCTFLYFKPSGKWKYEGRGKFPHPPGEDYYDVDRAAIQRENGGMPGISTDGSDLVVIVMPDDACDAPLAYPRMLMPTT